MALTPRGYPYAALTDAPNGPTQEQGLATAVDTDVGGVDSRKLTQAVYQVQASPSLVTVANATERLVANYDTDPEFETDPSGLISFASGVFTLGAAGLWGWSAALVWPAVDSSAIKHTRLLYLKRNGTEIATRSGKATMPMSAGAWGAMTQSTVGNVVTTDAVSTVQLAAFADPGVGTLDIGGVLFAVWLMALAD